MWPKKETYWHSRGVLCVSVPFTWRLPFVRRHIQQGDMFRKWSSVLVGGPACDLMPDYFSDVPYVWSSKDYRGVLQRINPQATKTTTGCTNKCEFCAVPQTEGGLIELDDWPNLPIVCDNNLLAASDKHIDRVMDRLELLEGVDFNQGLDCRLLNDHHAERIGRIKGASVRMALDHDGLRDKWLAAVDLLTKHGTAKSRISSYVIVAHTTDPRECWNRCQFVVNRGVTVNPQWFHELDAMKHNEVTDKQFNLGWTDKERTALMGWYYMKRGKPRYTGRASDG